MNSELASCFLIARRTILDANYHHIGAVPFSSLEQAFGPTSLGIILVKDLPSRYSDLRHRLLSYSSYLANLPGEELGRASSILEQFCLTY